VRPARSVAVAAPDQDRSKARVNGLCIRSAATGDLAPRDSLPTGSRLTFPSSTSGSTPAVSSEVLPIPVGPDRKVTGLSRHT